MFPLCTAGTASTPLVKATYFLLVMCPFVRWIIPKNNDLVKCSQQTPTNHKRIPWMASLGGFIVSFPLIFSFPHFSLSWTLIPFFFKGKIEQTNKNTMACFPKPCALTPACGRGCTSDWAGSQGIPSSSVQIACLQHQFLVMGVSAFPKTCIRNTQPCPGNTWSHRSAEQCRD